MAGRHRLLVAVLLLTGTPGCIVPGGSSVTVHHSPVGEGCGAWSTELVYDLEPSQDGFENTFPVPRAPVEIRVEPRLEEGRATVVVEAASGQAVLEATVDAGSSTFTRTVDEPEGTWTAHVQGDGAGGALTVNASHALVDPPEPFTWEETLVADSDHRSWTWPSPGTGELLVGFHVRGGEGTLRVLAPNGTALETVDIRPTRPDTLGFGSTRCVVGPEGEWGIELETENLVGNVTVELEVP